ncbi:phosphatase PAP2 family protein [Hymenobacter volaticus]|uniref:Phosphatase PAP2 family protein n=1 Tax=Hymenobacter volaticus TaxID=2932254 RepID=A0ABY4G7J2_9BACT|nr:phosphatase PAP2 family protein [Hymenobacter volaticus]UOQ66589.1 phosphatase PAP2 family protein [Hymenobacter volaticus]
MKAKLFVFVFCWLLATQGIAQQEPGAGEWKTWVIPSGAAYRLPPPPSAKATRAEAQRLQALTQQRDSADIQLIRYWSAGAPGYRWQAIIDNLTTDLGTLARTKLLVNVAIYDATVAAWDSKYAYRRPRPTTKNPQLAAYLPNPDNPSYPSEHAVAASAAAEVLAYLFPAKADSLRQLAEDAGRSRLLAGVAYPSDVEAGTALGRHVAAAVIAYAKTDSCDTVWKGTMPTQAGLWHDKRTPMGAAWGNRRPFILTSGRQFRPGPPPDPAAGMKELKEFKRTPEAIFRTFYWAANTYWGEETDRKLFENNLYLNAPRAARVYALTSIATYDASIACWDAKYTYWCIRPYQYDSTFAITLPGTPPHPSYPSGHATISNARATVLSYLFPEDRKLFQQKAKEAAESRFEAGIHFRIDNTVGLEMGEKVGLEVVKRARQDGADAPPKLAKR